jgi:ribonuclease HI
LLILARTWFAFGLPSKTGCDTNNQIEYEALLFELMHLDGMGIKDVDVFGDLLLVVQQVRGEFQCLDGMLCNYLANV